MKFNLVSGTLIKRYKRFLADVKLDDSGETLTVHVPNSGSMKGVSTPGSPCLLSVSPNPKRKLSHTLEMVKPEKKSWVGVNTANTNKLVAEAFNNKMIPQWRDFTEIKPEVKINAKTRLDFLLSNAKKKRYVEVKNVSMSEPPFAVFPDAVTERGQKHLEELMKLVKTGLEAEIIFVVQREDCEHFKPCDIIDPAYGRLLRKAHSHGVLISAWVCKMNTEKDLQEIKIIKEIPIQL